MSTKPQLKIKKRFPEAVMPEYKKEKDSGFDLSLCLREGEPGIFMKDGVPTHTLWGGNMGIFDTGLTFEIPEGYEVQIRPRSGLACKDGITVINAPGTIDEQYRGPIKIGLINLSKVSFVLKHGMRVAQAVLCPVTQAEIIEVEDISEDTDRGTGGFGHTGKV